MTREGTSYEFVHSELQERLGDGRLADDFFLMYRHGFRVNGGPMRLGLATSIIPAESIVHVARNLPLDLRKEVRTEETDFVGDVVWQAQLFGVQGEEWLQHVIDQGLQTIKPPAHQLQGVYHFSLSDPRLALRLGPALRDAMWEYKARVESQAPKRTAGETAKSFERAGVSAYLPRTKTGTTPEWVVRRRIQKLIDRVKT